MMDEELDLGNEILLKSVEKSGIPLPKGVSTIQTLTQTPGALFSICTRSLHRIDNSLLLEFVTKEDDDQEQEEDSIISMAEKFNLCKQMSDAFERLGFMGGQISFHQFLYPSQEDSYILLRFLVERLSDAETSSKSKHKEQLPESLNNTAEQVSISGVHLEPILDMCAFARSVSMDSKEDDEQVSEPCVSRNKENVSPGKDINDTILGYEVVSLPDQSSHVDGAYIQPLEKKPGMQLTQDNVKEIERETKAITMEIQKREEELCKLRMELEKRPKTATRKSYIQRISEITKNSRKQDADIEQILKDTRDLQIESNTIQERLHRTYAVADETISRDMKKDLVRQHAYRLITTIHESFAQISEKILVTDRIRREIVGVEEKLAAGVSSRDVNMNMEKLEADLDSMRK